MGDVIAFPADRRARRNAGPSVPAAVSTPSPVSAEPSAVPARSIVLPTGQTSPAEREPLWREVTGSVLRAERRRQQRTLSQVAERAGMSVQYLSELERGRKEASSEMLAAACGSLGLTIGEFARRCANTVTSTAARPTGPVLLAA
jgi:hypothetical protein